MCHILLLMTVCLASVSASQAHCCQCDCPHSKAALHPSQYIYVHEATPQDHAVKHHQYEQDFRVDDVQHSEQPKPNIEEKSPGLGYYRTGHYQVVDHSSGKDHQVQPVVAAISKSIGYQQEELKQHEREQENTETSDHFKSLLQKTKPQKFRVFSDQAKHYINIEQYVTPQKNYIGDDKHSDKDHHHDKNAYYKFEYEVNDQKTHDFKRQKEERKGDVVQGEYSLLEDNGNVRTVKYYADWKTGFHAQVHNSKGKSLG